MKAWFAVLVSLFLGTAVPARAGVDCAGLAQHAQAEAARFSPPASYRVSGKGRLYFHAAPDARCRSPEVFVVGGDSVAVYFEYRGWYSVMYINPRSGEDFQGWIRSRRLQYVGTLAPG